MIHFTCDCCHRNIDPEQELRYVVRMEVYAALDATSEDYSDDSDHLQEINEILDRLDDLEDEQISSDVYKQVRYDLCSACRRQFLKNPLGRVIPTKLNFSNN